MADTGNELARPITLGLFYSPWDDAARPRGIFGRLNDHYRGVLMPRSAAYMEQAFKRSFPEGVFRDVQASPDWRELIRKAETVILLYPDPIGFNCGRLFADARRHKPDYAAIRMLNGRQRTFLLTSTARIQLALRRAATRLMLAEIAIGGALLVMSPFLVLLDLARGRR
jgi:hypothetical protein